jgi:hypothetical protein
LPATCGKPKIPPRDNNFGGGTLRRSAIWGQQESAALLTRKHFATRDVFDTWFFLKNNWPINENLFTKKTGLSLLKALKSQNTCEGIKGGTPSRPGDLLDNKRKD